MNKCCFGGHFRDSEAYRSARRSREGTSSVTCARTGAREGTHRSQALESHGYLSAPRSVYMPSGQIFLPGARNPLTRRGLRSVHGQCALAVLRRGTEMVAGPGSKAQG